MVFCTQSLQQRREHDGSKRLWKKQVFKRNAKCENTASHGANAVVILCRVLLEIDLSLVGVWKARGVKMQTQKP
jgi:hypothetical protein